MASLERLRRKVRGVEDMRSIVKTMKALAAASIRQFEEAAAASDGYAQTIESGFQALLRGGPVVALGGGSARRKASARGLLGAVVVGSDRGMCGQFNESVAEFFFERMDAMGCPPERRLVLAAGERLASPLEEAGQKLDGVSPLPNSAANIDHAAQDILLRIDAWRREKSVERVLIFRNERTGAASFAPKAEQLLPLDAAWLKELARRPWPTRCVPACSMDRQKLFGSLVRQRLFITLCRALAESLAGENASRLRAMQAAEKNIDERLERLGADYNHSRQSSIDEELMDIVAGARGGGR